MRGLALFFLLSSACANGGVQRATLGPVSARGEASPPIGRRDDGVLGGVTGRYRLVPMRSDFRIYASDVITGEHRMTFERWVAIIDTTPSLSLRGEVDMTSLRASPDALASYARRKILEVDRYPRAVLSCALRPLDVRAGTYAVEGELELHGVRRPIRFVGSVERRGDDFRFRAELMMSRAAFDVRVPPPWDALVKDEIRVVIDAVASPERITVEEEPEGAAPSRPPGP